MSARKVAIGCFTFLLLLAAAVGSVLYVTYWRYQSNVNVIISGLPRAEQNLPGAVADVFGRIPREEVDRWVAGNLLWDIKVELRGLTWHSNFLLWELMLPANHSRRERLALFAHYLIYEEGRGLEGAAQFYYGAPPAQPTVEQVLGLLAISRGPHRFSPSRQPERFRQEVERLRRRDGAVTPSC